MNPLIDRVSEVIGQRGLLSDSQSILVAVSGGLDSIVLLQVLRHLADRTNWRLVVAHFNHQLRGADSEADEQWVRDTARNLRLECATGRGEVDQFRQRHGISIEMAARKLRHDFLADTARRFHCLAIALAHHADDQVELFFLRLLRGAGGLGLAGMKWTNPSPSDPAIRLVRPLLDQPKAALLAFAQEFHLRFREDATNAQWDLQRNRIRQELLPLLREKYQPALAHTVSRAMEIMGAESDYAESAARQWLATKPHPDFGQLPRAVQRQILLLKLLQLGVTPQFDLIEQLRCAPDRPVMTAPGLILSRDGAGEIHSRPAGAPRFSLEEQSVDLSDVNGKLTFSHLEIEWRISLAPTDAGQPETEPSDPALPTAIQAVGPPEVNQDGPGGSDRIGRRSAAPISPAALPTRPGREFFDADKVGGVIVLRHWRPGDRFQPIGMPSAVKLQDLFTNRKVPRSWRHQRVVAVAGNGEIFWVESLRIGEGFKLDKRTSRRLKWEWQQARIGIAGGTGAC